MSSKKISNDQELIQSDPIFMYKNKPFESKIETFSSSRK